jgi:hypothetical protein
VWWKARAALLACVGFPVTSGCGETDILALDRSNVVTVPDASGIQDAAEVEVQAEAEAMNGLYIEAESGQLSGGFTIGNDPTASGGQFIAPPAGMTSDAQPGPARALYEITITTSGTYTIWGRIQSPDTGHNRFWAQVDGESWYLWYITTGEIWYWNRVHNNTDYYTRLTFDLAAGTHQLLLANAADGVRLDRLYLTTGREVPVGNNTMCRPPDSIQVDGGCIPSCGSLLGNKCGAQNCAAGRIVPVPVYDCPICCMVP